MLLLNSGASPNPFITSSLMVDHEHGVETEEHQKMRGTGYTPRGFRSGRAVG
jgi:hypothetical protein